MILKFKGKIEAGKTKQKTQIIPLTLGLDHDLNVSYVL